MSRPVMHRTTLLFPLALLTACERKQEVAAPVQSRPGPVGQGPATPLGLAPWHADFPVEVHVSPHTQGYWYARTPRQALEQVVANLSGACSREAWLMARDFFKRAPPDAAPLLAEAAARAMHAPERGEVLENTLDAIGAFGDPALARTLLRALEHSRDGMRHKAMRAMIGAGTEETLLEAKKLLPGLDLRTHADWIRALRSRLGAKAVTEYRQVLARPELKPLHKEVLTETARLPESAALELLKPLFAQAQGEDRALLGAMLHQKGDQTGTAYLRDLLRSDKPHLRQLAASAAAGGDLQWLLADLLKLSADDDARVRLAVAQAITTLPGENITKTLEVLALDVDTPTRQAALFALRQRGERRLLDEMVQKIRTATGTELRSTLDDLCAAQDGKAVPAMQYRYERSNGAEARHMLRCMAFTRSKEALPALRAIFLGAERAFDERMTTVTYTPIVLANVTEGQDFVREMFQTLPRSDYRRRALLLHTLANMVPIGQEQERGGKVYALFRQLLADRAEEPQIRLLALQYLRKDLRLDDAIRVAGQLEAEAEPMRKALNDFLFEFF